MAKRYEVKITQYAEQSMREIAAYIAVDLIAPEAAVNLMKAFQTEINKLDFMPERIHLTPEEPWHSLGMRRMVVKNYYVYFLVDEEKDRVQVTDVTYVKRNQQKRFGNMPLES